MAQKRRGTLPYKVEAGTWTVRKSDRIKLRAEARRLTRMYGKDVNESEALRHTLEKIKAPDEKLDADLLQLYFEAIEEEGGNPAITFPQKK